MADRRRPGSRPAGLPIGEGIGRQIDYWWTVYKRTWRGSVISSFVTPLFYVLAMGVLLGGFIEGDPRRARGRDVLPRVRRAGAGRRPGDADRCR